MRTGYRWLLAGAAAAALAFPGSPAAGQVPSGLDVPTGVVPGAGAPGTGPLGSFRPPPPIRPGQAISVLVFPFGYAGEAGGAGDAGAPAAPAEPAADPNAPAPAGDPAAEGPALSPEQAAAAAQLTAAVKAGLLATPSFTVATYHPQSSLIQRARKDDILRPDDHLKDLVAPATGSVDPAKAKTVAHRLSIQSYLLGTIDMKRDPAANTVELTLELNFLNSTSGEPIRPLVAVSGAAAGAEGVPFQAILDRAVLETAQKAIQALGITFVPLGAEGEAPKAAAPAKASKVKETKEQRDARLKAEREAKKAAEEAKRAEAAARRQAERAAKEAREAARKAEEARRKAERDAGRQAPRAAPKPAPEGRGQAGGAKTAAASGPAAGPAVQEDTRVSQAQPAMPPAAQPVPPPPAAGTVVTAPGIVPGTANSAGMPVPYGYAIGDARTAIPPRSRSGLRVPPWLGVAAFLTGFSFLL